MTKDEEIKQLKKEKGNIRQRLVTLEKKLETLSRVKENKELIKENKKLKECNKSQSEVINNVFIPQKERLEEENKKLEEENDKLKIHIEAKDKAYMDLLADYNYLKARIKKTERAFIKYKEKMEKLEVDLDMVVMNR